MSPPPPARDVEHRLQQEQEGLRLRAARDYASAARLYREIADLYQAGYCEVLQGNLSGAREYWIQVVEQRSNHWCLTLFGLLTRQVNSYPTLFQIRNHLESDIANLIHAGQLAFLENLLAYDDFLAQINLETHKFIGRALFNAGWLDRGGYYLSKGQRTLFNDPEIYFYLAQYQNARQKPDKARLMLNQCLLISPSYTPAQDLLASLLAV